MGALGRTLALTEVPFTPATYDGAFAPQLAGLPTATPDQVLGGIPAAWACTVARSEDVAKVPLQMFELSGSDRRVARDHPIYDILHSQANTEHTAIEFREYMTATAINRGKAVAAIIPGPRGPVDQLEPLIPDFLTSEVLKSGVRRYRYQDPVQQRERVFLRDELFILRGRFGVGVITFARRNFELQLAMQRLSAEMYGRGLRSPGYLSAQKPLTKGTREKLREALNEYMGNGERAGRPLLLDEGMKWETISMSLEDAEFLATLQNADVWCAQWYRVPMHKLQRLSPGTHASLQQQATDYVVDSVLGDAIRWEQAIRRDLIVNRSRFAAEHNLEGLLRGDTKTRYEAYQIGVVFGWLTRAEVRERENLNAIPGLEKPLLPLNMSAQVSGLANGNGSGAMLPSSPAVVSYLRLLVKDGAARVVRKEQAALAKISTDNQAEWSRGVREFYREHAEFTARILRIPDDAAAAWAEARMADLLSHGPTALEHPESEAVADLTELALDKSVPLQQDRPQVPQLSAGPPRTIRDLVEVA